MWTVTDHIICGFYDHIITDHYHYREVSSRVCTDLQYRALQKSTNYPTFSEEFSQLVTSSIRSASQCILIASLRFLSKEPLFMCGIL